MYKIEISLKRNIFFKYPLTNLEGLKQPFGELHIYEYSY